jgi:nitroreductase
MGAWQAINSVRAVREFEPRPLARDELTRILNSGRRAGSSRNQQRWAFILVTEPHGLADLARVGLYAGHVARAAAAVALVTPMPTSARQAASIMWDLGRAAQNMVLAAWELGIASCPATVHEPELARQLLHLPSEQECRFLLAFGYPGDPSVLHVPNVPGGRRHLDEILHLERW